MSNANDSDSWFSIIRDSLTGKQRDYTLGSVRKAVIVLAIPMMLEMAMESLFAITDIYWISTLGKEATAAVGLTESVSTLIYAVAIGLSMALTATVARRIGEKNARGASVAAAQGLYIGAAVAVVTGLPAFVYGREILQLMGAEAAVVEVGADYTAILLGTNIVIIYLFLNNAIFRGAGDAALAMRALWLGNGINIALDPCLIYGWGSFPEMGLAGAAMATVIGRGSAVFYQFWAFYRHKSLIQLNRSSWSIDTRVIVRMVRISLGGILQMLIATTSWIALMRILAPFGSAALAGYTIALRVILFTILPSWGLSNAVATLVGQNLGAGSSDRAVASVKEAGVFNMVFLTLVMVAFLAFAQPIVEIFIDDPEVVEMGVITLRFISLAYPFYAWGMILVQAFNGAGDTMTPTWINVFCFWMFQIPLAWMLSRCLMSPTGVVWAILASDIAMAIVGGILFARGMWKEKEV
ncbi:MAG TPA: MATE family efflux transporter [Opitutae bacterium]|nr:MATE family efflux transporter [Opitutaceae bacterium]HCR29604.1 MATE family efflux transporter [Opitutae bacterium]